MSAAAVEHAGCFKPLPLHLLTSLSYSTFPRTSMGFSRRSMRRQGNLVAAAFENVDPTKLLSQPL